MNKKVLSAIAAIAAAAAILPGLNLSNLNTTPVLSVNAADEYTETNNDYGWFYEDNNWYFRDENGNLTTNDWVYYDGCYYYLNDSGKMVTNDWIYDPYYGSYYYLGLDGKEEFGPELFDSSTGISTSIGYKTITQTKTIGDKTFNFVIDLEEWKQHTSPSQIKEIANLFWECYPKMYNRFAKDIPDTDITVTIRFPQTGGIHAAEHTVYVEDVYLEENIYDFDCVVHELAHTLQNRYNPNTNEWIGWKGDKCSHSDYIENFADYCRYVYSYKEGYYNDDWWEPRKYRTNNRASDIAHQNSIRFLIWLDYKYSTADYDLIVAFSDVCRSEEYDSYNWDAAWSKIFEGSDALRNRSISNVWNEYENDTYFSDANSTTGTYGVKSQLMKRFPDLRSKLAR